MKVGRPLKYTLEFCTNEILSFLEIIEKDEKFKFITWQDLVKGKPYSRQRISEWRTQFKDNKLFSDTLKKIEDELENRMFKLGLSNKANTALVIFWLKNNYGWKDKTEIDHTTKGDKIVNNLTDEEIDERINKIIKQGK